MAYDEQLASRIRGVLVDRTDVVEKKMFGGLTFMVRGHMACGVHKDTLMVRLGEDEARKALAERHVREMDLTGRPMRGFLFVEPDGVRTGPDVERWVRRAVAFNETQPPK